MKKPIEVKKKLKKVTEYTACFAFLMFLQGVGAPMVFADATTAISQLTPSRKATISLRYIIR